MKWGYTEKEATLEDIQRQVGPGWSRLIEDLVEDINALGWDGTVYQVKEKFGGLRFYIGFATDDIFDRIQKAEVESLNICEDCGKPGKAVSVPRDRIGPGSIRTLCEECWK